jgi:hypothetical protein
MFPLNRATRPTNCADASGPLQGQHRPNATVTADNVVTFGAGEHGAGSCEPNGYQAVSSQRAIGVGNFLGNSENPTVLRL